MKFDGKTNITTIFFRNTLYYSRNSGPVLLFKTMERFLSRGQHLCKFSRTKERLYVRKQFNSDRIYLEHQHGLRFIVLGHQYGRRDVMTTSPPGLFPFFLRKSPGDEFELRILQAKFSWIPDSTSKNFSDTAIRISLHGILFRGSQWGGLFDG